jgi:hypothetical protein
MRLLEDQAVRSVIRRGENDFAKIVLMGASSTLHPEILFLKTVAAQYGLQARIHKHRFVELSRRNKSAVFDKSAYTGSFIGAYLTSRRKLTQKRLAEQGITLANQAAAGIELRLLTVNGKVLSAIASVPACVVADGKRTILELLEAKTARRRHHPLREQTAIRDRQAKPRESVNLARIPNPEEVLPLISLLAEDAEDESIEMVEFLPSAVHDIANRISLALPALRYAEIVLGCNSLAGDDPFQVTVYEVNSAPAIGTRCFPNYGSPVAALDHVLHDSAAFLNVCHFASAKNHRDLHLVLVL